ncbi:hypothetical protein Ddye_018992 [Dipteronia dyeriana]|uniref:Uncharacterized protein n=1 Tax=Dipteronia dyeriana TaxID=168575 RepID=A0AAD9TXG4_9ROSI|nr:hypothetical protein Ddye_018992 [Dipteronia dyeriana]
MATRKVRLTLIIDKGANKVICAEAGKDFVDILFNFISLPIGTIFKLFRNSITVGCIRSLYMSLENLSEAFLQSNQSKDELLKLQVASVSISPGSCSPKPAIETRKRYIGRQKKRHGRDAACNTNPRSTYLNPEGVLPIVNLSNAKTVSASEGGTVKEELVKDMVTDDLSVAPESMTFVADLLQHYVKDFGALEKRVVEFGTDEVIELLKSSLMSNAALSNAFLVKKEIKDVA